jgi:hypothetical protein
MTTCIHRTLIAFALLVVVGFGAIACASTPSSSPTSQNGSLSFSVKSRPGGIVASVSDSRVGKHTVWVVLLDPPKGRHREFFAAMNNGGGNTGTSSGSGLLASGTYRYAVYDVDGLPQGSGARFWTPEHKVGSGEVTVP